MNVFSIKDPVYIFVHQKGKDTARNMKLIIICLSLTMLVLADKQSHNFLNDDRYIDGYPYAASTIGDTGEIFEPDFVDSSKPIITLNYNQESTGIPLEEASTERVQRYFRVRRPIKRRKIFHIRRENINSVNEPVSESLQVSDITPVITQTSQQEYPASTDTSEYSNTDDGLDNLPSINDFSKDSIIYVSQQTPDINQQINPTNEIEPVYSTILPDLTFDISGRSRMQYHNQQKLRELEEINDMEKSQAEKENELSNIDTPFTLEESNTASTLTMSPKLYKSNENNVEENSKNDFQGTRIPSGDIETKTSNPVTPIIEVIIETDPRQLQQLPRMHYQGRRRNNNRQRIDILPEVSVESPEEQEESERSLPDQIKLHQIIPNMKSRPENNKNDFHDFNINDDNEEIIPSSEKIETIDRTPTIPIVKLEAMSSTKKIPRLRRKRIRGRRILRKNTGINNIPHEDSVQNTSQKNSEEVTTVKILTSSIELFASQKDNLEENSKQENVLTQKINTTDRTIPATVTSSTKLIHSVEVPESRDRVRVPYRRYHGREQFRKHKDIDNISHQTENMSDTIESTTTSTAPQSRFENVNNEKTLRSPYMHYRSSQKFRKLNKGNNLSEVTTQNVPNLETVTTSTIQQNNTENLENNVVVPEILDKNRDNATQSIRKMKSRTFTRQRLRLNPTTVKSEMTPSPPSVSELDFVSTDKPNHPQHQRILNRKRFRRIKNTTQSTTIRSTTASVGSEEDTIAAEDNENKMSQKQPKRDFKTQSTPPPVPTLSPWFDGFGK